MSARMVSARQIVGRRIIGFDPKPFSDGRGFATCHDPEIVLDDGSVLVFVTEETGKGSYGTWIGRRGATSHRAKLDPRRRNIEKC